MVRYIEVMFRGLGLGANLLCHVQASHYSMFRYIVVMSRGLGHSIILQGHVQVSHYGMFKYNGTMVSEHSYTIVATFMSRNIGLDLE